MTLRGLVAIHAALAAMEELTQHCPVMHIRRRRQQRVDQFELAVHAIAGPCG